VFPEALPEKKMRQCLHCRRPFLSSSAAERVCPKCRRKHNKLLEKFGGIITYASTTQMDNHLKRITEHETIKDMLTVREIDDFLDGDNSVDDSCVYGVIKKEEEKETAPVDKPGAVFILISLLSKEKYNVPSRRKSKQHYW